MIQLKTLENLSAPGKVIHCYFSSGALNLLIGWLIILWVNVGSLEALITLSVAIVNCLSCDPECTVLQESLTINRSMHFIECPVQTNYSSKIKYQYQAHYWFIKQVSISNCFACGLACTSSLLIFHKC